MHISKKTASTWPPLQVALRSETDVFNLLPATSTSETAPPYQDGQTHPPMTKRQRQQTKEEEEEEASASADSILGT